jgi:hypothetical protein
MLLMEEAFKLLDATVKSSWLLGEWKGPTPLSHAVSRGYWGVGDSLSDSVSDSDSVIGRPSILNGPYNRSRLPPYVFSSVM